MPARKHCFFVYLGILCGNNEMEEAICTWECADGFDPLVRSDYLKLYENILPKICAEHGLVIATGGGAPVQSGNGDLIRQNSRVLYLRRPTEALPTDGRPISRRTDAAALWAQRRTQYEAFADTTVDNTSAIEQTAAYLLKEWNER